MASGEKIGEKYGVIISWKMSTKPDRLLFEGILQNYITDVA